MGLRPLVVPAEVTAQLAVAATDDDAEVRWEALFALGTLGSSPLGPDVAERIVRMLDDRDSEIRVAAALVAGRLGVSSGGEGLVYLLNDPSDRVQLAAMEALGDLREVRAAVALSQRVEYYQRGSSAEAALRAVARIGHSSSLSLFESFAGARDASLRRFAFEGIGRAGREDLVAWLQQVTADEKDEATHLATQFALQRLQRSGLAWVVAGLGNNRLARQARDYLIEFGSGQRSDARRTSARRRREGAGWCGRRARAARRCRDHRSTRCGACRSGCGCRRDRGARFGACSTQVVDDT